jgi:hypothetical protein
MFVVSPPPPTLFFHYTLRRQINILLQLFGIMSCNLPFIFDLQSHIKQLNILTNRTLSIGMYSVLIPKDLVGSSLIGRLKTDRISKGMLLDVRVSPKKEKQLKTHKRTSIISIISWSYVIAGKHSESNDKQQYPIHIIGFIWEKLGLWCLMREVRVMVFNERG